jgi:hypothetical protein
MHGDPLKSGGGEWSSLVHMLSSGIWQSLDQSKIFPEG